MIIDTEKKHTEEHWSALGSRLSGLPYRDMSLIDLCEIYAYTLATHGRGVRLSLVIDELNKRTELHDDCDDCDDVWFDDDRE